MRRLFHERWRTRVSLLAAACLDGPEREATLRHLEACEECRREHAEALAVLALLAADPSRDAELPVASQFLAARVQARVEAVTASRPFRWATWAYSLGLAAALVVLVPLLVGPVASWMRPAMRPGTVSIDDGSLRRVERARAREQAVRYLNEAQDVLVTLAAASPPCVESDRKLDLTAESERSREILERRLLLVELEDDTVASARPVLEDVDEVLREVAALESCARPGDVERLRREVERRRLVMKIQLMTRELQG